MPAAAAADDRARPKGTERHAGGGRLYLHVDDADQLTRDWRKAGVTVAGPEDRDYGKREGWHADPDGNKIQFGSPLRRPAK